MPSAMTTGVSAAGRSTSVSSHLVFSALTLPARYIHLAHTFLKGNKHMSFIQGQNNNMKDNWSSCLWDIELKLPWWVAPTTCFITSHVQLRATNGSCLRGYLAIYLFNTPFPIRSGRFTYDYTRVGRGYCAWSEGASEYGERQAIHQPLNSLNDH